MSSRSGSAPASPGHPDPSGDPVRVTVGPCTSTLGTVTIPKGEGDPSEPAVARSPPSRVSSTTAPILHAPTRRSTRPSSSCREPLPRPTPRSRVGAPSRARVRARPRAGPRRPRSLHHNQPEVLRGGRKTVVGIRVGRGRAPLCDPAGRSQRRHECDNGPVTIAANLRLERRLRSWPTPTRSPSPAPGSTADQTTLSGVGGRGHRRGRPGTRGTSVTSVTTGCRFLVQKRSVVPNTRQRAGSSCHRCGRPTSAINIEPVEFDGNLFYDGSGDGCATIDRYNGRRRARTTTSVLSSGQFVCWPQPWDDVVDEPPPARHLPADLDPATPASDRVTESCRVFEPGGTRSWTSRSAATTTSGRASTSSTPSPSTLVRRPVHRAHAGTHILAGYPPDDRFETRLITGSSASPRRPTTADGPTRRRPTTGSRGTSAARLEAQDPTQRHVE